ncbi:condensed mesenchymal cell proliferation [Homalodisca vitripennis]|nr:condensed mesenchymal cell proliferation [Homalodisca vitripennis]
MVKVQLTDVNDNWPIFYPREYNVTLRSGVVSQGAIVVVAASDRDSGRLGAVTYQLVSGNEGNLFRVDRTTGEVLVNRPNLPSRPGSYRLNVSATDGAGLRSLEDAEVFVTVSDKGPLFEKTSYNFNAREDVPRNTMVGAVKAISSALSKTSMMSCETNLAFGKRHLKSQMMDLEVTNLAIGAARCSPSPNIARLTELAFLHTCRAIPSPLNTEFNDISQLLAGHSCYSHELRQRSAELAPFGGSQMLAANGVVSPHSITSHRLSLYLLPQPCTNYYHYLYDYVLYKDPLWRRQFEALSSIRGRRSGFTTLDTTEVLLNLLDASTSVSTYSVVRRVADHTATLSDQDVRTACGPQGTYLMLIDGPRKPFYAYHYLLDSLCSSAGHFSGNDTI